MYRHRERKTNKRVRKTEGVVGQERKERSNSRRQSELAMNLQARCCIESALKTKGPRCFGSSFLLQPTQNQTNPPESFDLSMTATAQQNWYRFWQQRIGLIG